MGPIVKEKTVKRFLNIITIIFVLFASAVVASANEREFHKVEVEGNIIKITLNYSEEGFPYGASFAIREQEGDCDFLERATVIIDDEVVEEHQVTIRITEDKGGADIYLGYPGDHVVTVLLEINNQENCSNNSFKYKVLKQGVMDNQVYAELNYDRYFSWVNNCEILTDEVVVEETPLTPLEPSTPIEKPVEEEEVKEEVKDENEEEIKKEEQPLIPLVPAEKVEEEIHENETSLSPVSPTNVEKSSAKKLAKVSEETQKDFQPTPMQASPDTSVKDNPAMRVLLSSSLILLLFIVSKMD